MSARIPSRRLGRSAFAALQPLSTRWVPSLSLRVAARRNASSSAKPKGGDKDLSNPLLEEYLKKKRIQKQGNKDRNAGTPALRQGKMSQTNPLFLPERELPGWNSSLSAEEQAKLKARAEARKAEEDKANDLKLSDFNMDPSPRSRRRLERKLVISSVKRHGRLSKAQSIARKERQSLFKSQNLPTSTKKLQKVVNQIAGKTVSEALVQLRFSKKRVAKDVIKGLEIAQNEAIVGRGMGLGSGAMARKRWRMQRDAMDSGNIRDITLSKGERAAAAARDVEPPVRPKTIEMKDGSKKLVRDPSEIYIDQAWVGKGEMWKSPEFRARGTINMLRHRTTSFTVLLKEEKTRMRISEEIQKKRNNRKLWTALPDRPITAQRQYCLW